MLSSVKGGGNVTSSILIVDDDEAVRDVVRDVLEEEGYRVLAAASSKAALQMLAREDVALVLLDQMGPRDDLQTERAFARLNGRRPAIIVFSAVSDPAAVAARLRADGWVRKPFEIDELLAVVRRHARRD